MRTGNTTHDLLCEELRAENREQAPGSETCWWGDYACAHHVELGVTPWEDADGPIDLPDGFADHWRNRAILGAITDAPDLDSLRDALLAAEERRSALLAEDLRDEY